MRKAVIHWDDKRHSVYDHLSEEAIDRHCMHGTTGFVVHDTHLATCLKCTQRAWETSEFLRILDRAVEALVTGQTPSSSTTQ
jgi:hypothetical protein